MTGAVLRAVPDLARVSFARLVAYRAEMTIWILATTMPLIMLALWDTVASEGPVAGLGQTEFARYFAVTLLVRQLTSAWVIYQLNFEIRTGALSAKLLKPMHPIWYWAVWMLTAMPFRALIVTPMVVALVVWRPELWWTPSLLTLAVAVVSVFAAWLLNFLIQVSFGLLSFWIDKTDGLFGVYFSLWMLLAGYIAPYATFPEWAQQGLRFLPFRGMHALPTELLCGLIEVQDAWVDLGVQLGWCGVGVLGVAGLWKAGLRRYGAFGA